MFTVASEQVGSRDYVRQILLWVMVVPEEFITLVQEQYRKLSAFLLTIVFYLGTWISFGLWKVGALI